MALQALDVERAPLLYSPDINAELALFFFWGAPPRDSVRPNPKTIGGKPFEEVRRAKERCQPCIEGVEGHFVGLRSLGRSASTVGAVHLAFAVAAAGLGSQ